MTKKVVTTAADEAQTTPRRNRKSSAPKKQFIGELATPIEQEWEPPKYNAEGRALVAPSAGQVAQLRKLDALAKHYDAVSGDGKIDWPLLALRLARDFVPGFQIETVGAPPEAGGKRPRGQPTSPDVKARDLNMLVVRELLRRKGEEVDDADIAKLFAGFEVEAGDAEKGRRTRSNLSREGELKRKAKTPKNRLSHLASKTHKDREAHPRRITVTDPLAISRWVDLITVEGKTPKEAVEILCREMFDFNETLPNPLPEKQNHDPE